MSKKELINKFVEWTRYQACRLAVTRRPERILFIHVMKTAGTSFRHMLEDEYGLYLVYPGKSYLSKLPNGWYPSGSEMVKNYEKLPPHNVLTGHFTAAMADMLPMPYRTAIFLREPLQRSLSMIAHYSKIFGTPVSSLLENEKFMSEYIIDYQTKILGGDGVCDPHEIVDIDDKLLSKALSRIETIDFVGLTERFNESCLIFDKCFGTQVSRRMHQDNVLRPNGNELSECTQWIEPYIKKDKILYDCALMRFNSACY